MDAFWSSPPVTRTITAITFIQSILVYSRQISGFYIFFAPSHIFKFPPEIWRLFTSFMLTGPKIEFFFDLYNLYTFGHALETTSPRFSGPGDFFVYVVFVGTVILLTAGCYLGSGIFTRALIVALCYTLARDNQGKKTKFWMIPIPYEYLPWGFVVLDMVSGGFHAALLSLTGIFAAHMHDFLTRIYPEFGGGKNYVATPAFVSRIFGRGASRGVYRSYGAAYRPPREATGSGSGSGWSSGTWSARGQGRRLGGG